MERRGQTETEDAPLLPELGFSLVPGDLELPGKVVLIQIARGTSDSSGITTSIIRRWALLSELPPKLLGVEA